MVKHIIRDYLGDSIAPVFIKTLACALGRQSNVVGWAKNAQVLPIKVLVGGGKKSTLLSGIRFLERGMIDQTDSTPTEWITVKEAAKLTGYTAGHVYYLAQKGSMKGKKFKRGWSFNKVDVLAYAEKVERLGPAKYDPWRTGARQRIDLPERKPLEKEWELMSPDEIRETLGYLDDPASATVLAWVLGYKTSVTVTTACRQGRIPGAEKHAGTWHIPLEGVCEAIQNRRLRPKRKPS